MSSDVDGDVKGELSLSSEEEEATLISQEDVATQPPPPPTVVIDNLAVVEDTTVFGAKQDYRLDFTEVEGTLEAVPEEGMTSATPAAKPTTSASAQVGDEAVQPVNTSTPSQAQTTVPFFHIAESVASEFSDVSEQTKVSSSQGQTSVIKTSEPLSARQQVALWLTRTSMTDVSSVSSLHSLIFPSSSNEKPGPRTSSKAPRSHKDKNKRRKNDIHRNYSSKSLVNGYGMSSSKLSEQSSPLMMRKCETMVALSAGAASGAKSVRRNCRHSTSGSGGSKPSSLNLFNRLTGRSASGVAKTSMESQMALKIPNRPSFTESMCDSPFRGLRPINRLRSSSSIMCSHCASVTSFNNSRMTSRTTSQRSLFQQSLSQIRRTSTTTTMPDESEIQCKICLLDSPIKEMSRLDECGCTFCTECMYQYIAFEVKEGAYEISCPDPECEKDGAIDIDEMEAIVGKDIVDKHKAFRLNTEVALDKNRAWCPVPDCETICHVCDPSETASSTTGHKPKDSGVPVKCPSCAKEFCSQCSANWHPGKTCKQNGQDLFNNRSNTSGFDLINYDKFGGDIKPCPVCRTPIERDEGCAQMMCKRCKHVFCWFCSASLDDDFLLRHYDSGECKGRLGHSKASVLWHRAQVIGIFAGFGIMLLVASPLLLLAAPCILCCKCNKIVERLEAGASSSSSKSNSSSFED